jgi:hypothetical protein
MSSESNFVTQGTQNNKTTGKRPHRPTRNRPVLVTGKEEINTPANEVVDEPEPVAVAVEEPANGAVKPRRSPRFFANIGKTTDQADAAEADPKAARMARAMHGKPATTKETSVSAPKKSAAAPDRHTVNTVNTVNTVKPAPRPGGFKMRYIWGMMIYLLVADLLGGLITTFFANNHLDTTLFTWGPIVGKTSTLVFLAILVVLLILMARFDLLPRTFGAAMNTGAAAAGKKTTGKDTPTFESKSAQPTMKQGVQGADDDLYKEYRENQRYFQKRDRKR